MAYIKYLVRYLAGQVISAHIKTKSPSYLLQRVTHLRFMSGGGNERIKFGVAKLDMNGDITEIIAQKTVTANGTSTPCEEWLALPKRSTTVTGQERFAFFAERMDVDQAQYTIFTGAGVYFGVEGEIPQLETTPFSEGYGFFQTYATVPEAGGDISLKLPNVPMEYAPEKHFFYCITLPSGKELVEGRYVSMSRDGDTLTITGLESADPNCRVEGYYSKINKINYFPFTDAL
ncbi:hypothetical protein LCL85_18640 [Vibrio alginolyticus]|nr:hypothetical protein [Vibrio alginolyticus]